MSNLSNVTVAQLQRAIEIRERIDALNAELNEILGGEQVSPIVPRKKRGMSAAGRKAVARAQRLRWAKINADKNQVGSVRKRKPMSAAAKAKIAAAARARWARAKAAGKKRL